MWILPILAVSAFISCTDGQQGRHSKFLILNINFEPVIFLRSIKQIYVNFEFQVFHFGLNIDSRKLKLEFPKQNVGQSNVFYVQVVAMVVTTTTEFVRL